MSNKTLFLIVLSLLLVYVTVVPILVYKYVTEQEQLIHIQPIEINDTIINEIPYIQTSD